jgi:selenocysteine lyase/cysteine desulfurase
MMATGAVPRQRGSVEEAETTFDPERWRRDTPAAAAGRVHLNNAGASLMPEPVAAAVFEHLRLECQLGGYEAADAAQPAIAEAYRSVAVLVGAEPRNIAFVENATVAFQQALSTLDPGRGDVILTTNNDYVSNQLMYLSLRDRRGVEVLRAADLPGGGVDPDSVRRHVRKRRPALVSVTWVPTNSGLVQDVAAIGEICAEHDVPYIVDACQAVGQFPVDAAAVRCDFMAATARKFLRGPRGSGFLYASDRALERRAGPLHVDMRGADWAAPDRYQLGADARRFENWETAWALVLGTGAAAAYAARVGVDAAATYSASLAAYAREQIAALPGARVLDRGERRCSIVTVAFEDVDARSVMLELREQAINVSVTERGSAIIDMDEKGVASVLRLSPHYYNTRRDIDLAVGAIEGATQR